MKKIAANRNYNINKKAMYRGFEALRASYLERYEGDIERAFDGAVEALLQSTIYSAEGQPRSDEEVNNLIEQLENPDHYDSGTDDYNFTDL
tara:strand:- start:2282 stop:2554 length:273 start_codon:yes stop_codon:yes gene_type:complete